MTMRQLGLSIYPNHSNEAEDKAYLLLGEKYGFTRIFMSMLEANDVKATEEKFRRIIEFGNQHGFKTTLDVSPRI
ncbi:MAG: MupG family TIM beta-alpha barrel fold protein, partial [Lactobacillus sp.]|nr:MupG family TIM beta-alpha barrel fold protein [Lactobacillus sp.]